MRLVLPNTTKKIQKKKKTTNISQYLESQKSPENTNKPNPTMYKKNYAT